MGQKQKCETCTTLVCIHHKSQGKQQRRLSRHLAATTILQAAHNGRLRTRQRAMRGIGKPRAAAQTGVLRWFPEVFQMNITNDQVCVRKNANARVWKKIGAFLNVEEFVATKKISSL